MKSAPPTIPYGVVACTLIYQTTFLEIAVYIYIYTLVFKKVDISKICISFASLRETKEKTKGIYIYIYFWNVNLFENECIYTFFIYQNTPKKKAVVILKRQSCTIVGKGRLRKSLLPVNYDFRSWTYLLVDFDKGLFTLEADQDQCVVLTLQ